MYVQVRADVDLSIVLGSCNYRNVVIVINYCNRFTHSMTYAVNVWVYQLTTVTLTYSMFVMNAIIY